jgi:uncharacterized membrane protein YkvA (DUF1232 family)
MKRSLSGLVVDWFTNLIRNSKYRWFVILGSLIYLVSPLDISPDVFPIIGWIDDGLLATIVVTELTQIALEKRRNSKRTISQKSNANDIDTVNSVIDVESVTIG